MSTVTLQLGYSAANTAMVVAAGGIWKDACYQVPETAVALIAYDAAKFAKACAKNAKPRNFDAARTAGRLAGYSDADIESALRTSGGDDL